MTHNIATVVRQYIYIELQVHCIYDLIYSLMLACLLIITMRLFSILVAFVYKQIENTRIQNKHKHNYKMTSFLCVHLLLSNEFIGFDCPINSQGPEEISTL